MKTVHDKLVTNVNAINTIAFVFKFKITLTNQV